MTGLPADIEARLAAAAPRGIDYSSTTSPLRRRHRVVRPGRTARSFFAVGKVLLALGARLAMVSALQPPAPEEEEEETKSR